MKNKILLAALAIVLVFAMTACNNGSTGGGGDTKVPLSDTYTGVDGTGALYTLTIKQPKARFAILKDDIFELTVGSKKSEGIVSKDAANGVLELQPSKEGAEPFTVTIPTDGTKGITAISGTITFTDGSDPVQAASISPVTIIANGAAVETNNIDTSVELDFGYSWYSGNTYVKAADYTPGTVITVKDGKLTMMVGVPNNDILQPFWNDPAETMTVSTKEAKYAGSIEFYTSDGKYYLHCQKSRISNPDGYDAGELVEIAYLDRDVKVKGTDSWTNDQFGMTYNYTYDYDLKKGWNYLVHNYIYDPATKIQTGSWKSAIDIPSGYKWTIN
jgi:hypothetical protein